MDTNAGTDLDPALTRIAQAIDLSSAIPVSVQLRGALEYGIATGEILPGTRLPSVRKLAQTIGLSPVTVSSVFATLQERGHVEGRIGSGTFVADRGQSPAADLNRLAAFERQVAATLAAGRNLGLSVQDIALRLTQSGTPGPRALRILVLGTFRDATEAYAEDLRSLLAEADTVIPWTFDRQDGMPAEVDLILTPSTLVDEAERLFPGTPHLSLILIPNEETRIALARIPPDAQVLMVSYFDDFLPILKAGVTRFAPHLGQVRAVSRSAPELDGLIANCDVLIHATGADYLRASLSAGQSAIEYRHTPDRHTIRTQVLPTLDALRRTGKSTEGRA